MSGVLVQRGFSRLPGLASSRLPRLQCGLSSMSMYGSQTEPWSYVKQQTLDEYASKVCKHVVKNSRITRDLFSPLGMVIFIHLFTHNQGKAHAGTHSESKLVYGFSYSSSMSSYFSRLFVSLLIRCSMLESSKMGVIS